MNYEICKTDSNTTGPDCNFSVNDKLAPIEAASRGLEKQGSFAVVFVSREYSG